MKLASSQLTLWIAFGCLIGAIALEEDAGTTTPVIEAVTLTPTTSTTVTEPFTTTTTSSATSSTTTSSATSSTTTIPTTTTTSTTATSVSSSTTTSNQSLTAPILARANPIASNTPPRSILSTTTAIPASTTKPSTKRQISLSEFQQLVAKVNDEISMLRNQSANLSQTYEELVRRYNERTSQIPIVLYDATECSNGTTAQVERSTEPIAAEKVSNAPETTKKDATDSEESSTKEITTTTSITVPTTRKAEYSPPKLAESEIYPERVLHPETLPHNLGNSNTQIYGNKYYNYIHYFMYPPSESQLEDIEHPSPNSHRRKVGNDSRKAAPPRRRPIASSLKTKNGWEEQFGSQGEREPQFESRLPSSAFRSRPVKGSRPIGELRNSPRTDPRAPFRGSEDPAVPYTYDTKPTSELRSNLRPDSTDLRADFRRPADPAVPYPYEEPYRAGLAPQRIEPPLPKLPQYPFAQERIPPRIVPQEAMLPPQLPNFKQAQALETIPKAAPSSDKLTAFLERRKINRNAPYAVAPVKPPTTPASTTARDGVTPQSLENLFTFGAKPVSYSIPTTVKPLAGLVRNGWDGYDFSFVRKALESKKRLQRERRSWGARLREL